MTAFVTCENHGSRQREGAAGKQGEECSGRGAAWSSALCASIGRHACHGVRSGRLRAGMCARQRRGASSGRARRRGTADMLTGSPSREDATSRILPSTCNGKVNGRRQGGGLKPGRNTPRLKKLCPADKAVQRP